MAKALDRYWKQVHAIERMTGTTSAIARSAVTQLRKDRNWTSARETRNHPRVIAKLVRELERQERAPYKDLDDFIDSFESWDGEFDSYDIETSADY
jgi:hypothetical protein